MLVRLLPNQIAEVWSVIREDALKLLPAAVDSSNGTSISIVSQIMVDKANLWIFYPDDAVGEVNGFLITAVLIDELTAKRSLVIYAARSYKLTDEFLWLEVLDGLKAFARSRGCTSIIAFTNSERLVSVTEKLGGNVEFLLSFPVNGAL